MICVNAGIHNNSLYDKLIAYWPLDEASGNRAAAFQAANLTLTDNNTVTQAAGKIGNAAQFTAANSESLTVADSPALSLGNEDFTIAFWVNMDSLATMHFVTKGDIIADAYAFNIRYTSATSNIRIQISNGITSNQVQDPTTEATGTWYFVLCYYDSVNDLLGIQVNNNTASTVSNSTGMQDEGGDFNLGQSGAGSAYVDGKMDAVMFWKRLLTSAEKAYLYNSGNGRCPL